MNDYKGFECDFSLYPSKESQFKWLKVYLQSYLGKEDVSEKEIEDLYREVNKYALLSHYYWVSNINNIPYIYIKKKVIIFHNKNLIYHSLYNYCV